MPDTDVTKVLPWKNLSTREGAIVFFVALADSLRNELRIEGRHDLADKLRAKLQAFGIVCRDNPVSSLREFRDGYRLHLKMPNAPLWELECF
jgi:hypothetical protein